MKTQLLTLFLPLLMSAAPIEGAFGLKLGEIFQPTNALSQKTFSDGTIGYEFTPTNRYRCFHHYFVFLTPMTKRINTIYAEGSAGGLHEDREEQEVLMHLLSGKYGKEEETNVKAVKRICQAPRCVQVRVDDFKDGTIDIQYYDWDLIAAAKQEKNQAAAKAIDSSGL